MPPYETRQDIKAIRHIISTVVWLLVGILALLFILLHIPAVQSFLGTKTSNILSEKLGTTVKVGKINVGMLNRVIIDDLDLLDQQGEKALSASRLSATVDIGPLLGGQISVSSAQLFGVKAHLYKADAESPLNIQFILDSLASEEKDEKKPLHLNINSLVIRNSAVRYDRLDIPATPNHFSPHHLNITNLSGHLMLYQLSNDTIDLRVKRVTLKEHSGLDLRQLSLNLKATKESLNLTDLLVKLPNSSLQSDTIQANYIFDKEGLQKETLWFRGNIDELQLSPADIKFILPQAESFQNPVRLIANVSGTANHINLNNINLHSDDGLHLTTNGTVKKLNRSPEWFFRISQLDVKNSALVKVCSQAHIALPTQVLNLGDIKYNGEVGGSADTYALKGHLATDAGQADLAASLRGQHLSGHIDTDGINLRTILRENRLGLIATSIDVDGQLPINKNMSLYAKGEVSHFDLNGHTYNNITVDGFYDKESFNGTLGIDDPYGQIGLEGELNLSAATPSAAIKAYARHINPEALGLTSQLKGHVMDFDLRTDIQGASFQDLQGTVDLENLVMQSPKKNYQLSHLHIDADNEGSNKHVFIDSDFGDLNISGQYDFTTIVQSLSNVVKSKLPTFPYLPESTSHHQSEFEFSVDIDRSDWLRQFTDINLDINSPMHISGHVDEEADFIDLTCIIPSIDYNDGDYRDVDLRITTLGDSIITNMSLKKMQDSGKPLDLALNATAANNQLYTDIAFNNHGGKQHLRGSLTASSQFLIDDHHRKAAHVSMLPSQIFVNGMPWSVERSKIELASGDIDIDHFTIRNGEQHIIVTGALTDTPTDTLHVDLNRLDATFISSILQVKGVDFGGHISGNAFVTSVYDTPNAKADLMIDNFQFVDGRIGDLDIDVVWNAKDNRIEMDGKATDGPSGSTDINGYVVLSPGEINIDFGTHGTPLHFLKRFTSSFLGDIDTRINGHVRLFGPLSDINLEGKAVANGTIELKSLNTTYTLRDDTITLIPNHILFDHAAIYDKDGHTGSVTGSIDHDYLSNFTFDLGIHANNLLAYDFKDFGESTFCGTVYATGDCHIKGVSGEVTIDVDATPEKGTVFNYNASSPDMLNDQSFIQWNDITPEALDYSNLPSASRTAPLITQEGNDSSDEYPEEEDLPSNLRMNFHINATPDATLRLLMDAQSGDYIALYGNGTLRASYFNKGSFNLFGNYVVDHGIYKLTIQNVIKKDFQFQQGGTIAFGGNPYHAGLNLKALYPVNGVPLSDLNIGKNFTSNNIRVNCLMNITGTPERPAVDFDMELPTINNDAQQMVRSLIDSEEELNQQVIYLLTIGRFYNQNTNAVTPQGQTQTSLAMQSLLSGTISQQINNLLGSVIKSNNWNFGANISTGDEGFYNAEYEGLLSGNLFNNRLLINGQFGYRDNANATASFIGDFDIRYLIYPNGNLALKMYNQSNDRYFVKNSLNTQGIGLIMKKDFNGWRELVGLKRRKKK